MGLADILSNPGILGLAMAGLSRDPEAPYRTFGVLQGANEMARQAQADEEKKAQKTDTMALMQALMSSQQSQRTNPLEMLSKIKQYEKIDAMPDTTTSFTPDQQAGTATDFETGQSYTPKTGENASKLAATKAWFDSASKTNHPAEAAIEFSKYPNADPNFVLKYMQDHYNMNKEESNTLLKLVLEQQKEKAQLVRDESKSSLDFKRQKELKQMEIDAQAGKTPDTEIKLQAAIDRETDPAKKVQYQKTLDAVESRKIKIARESRTPRESKDRKVLSSDEKGPFVVDLDNNTVTRIDAGLKAVKPNSMDAKLKALGEILAPGAAKSGGATPVPTGHPLSGKPAGMYKVNGKVVGWDGSKEL